MVELQESEILSELLKAVSDTTRRSILTQLSQQGPSRVSDLANFYDMSLNAVSKHIKVLENAGLVKRRKTGRTHWIEADLQRMDMVKNWFEELRLMWELRLEKLDELLNTGDTQND